MGVRALILVAAMAVAPSPSLAAAKKTKPKPVPAASLTALNTHEDFSLRPDPVGRFGKKQLKGWNHFLRCHHTGRVHAMAPRLASLLYETAKHYEFKKLLVVAGYRAPRIARKKGNPKSPHKQGLACDFRVEGVANTELRDFLREHFARVGVGYYPNSDFVHLDVRQKQSAFWIDYSGPGERARYSRDPEGDLQDERDDATAVAGEEPNSDGTTEAASALNAQNATKPANGPGKPTPPDEPAPPPLVAPAGVAGAPALGGVEPQKNSGPWAPAPKTPSTAPPSP